MNRRSQLGTGLAVLAVVLFAVPAFFPVQPMLTHDTGETAPAPPEELRQQGYEIVAYENLTERGQELYVTTLENDGEYRVAVGEGADDFAYPTDGEVRAMYDNGTEPGIVVERPEDASSLPSSDERFYGYPSEDEDVNESQLEQRRQTIERYDAMSTRTAQPPLGATPQLIRLLSVLLAVLSLGVGGYLLSSK
jgi:hypothetical protein